MSVDPQTSQIFPKNPPKVKILDSNYVFVLHLWNMQFVYYHF